MRHRELVKHKCTTDKNVVNILKRRQEKQLVNATIQQKTAVRLPQHYSHDVLGDEKVQMI